MDLYARALLDFSAHFAKPKSTNALPDLVLTAEAAWTQSMVLHANVLPDFQALGARQRATNVHPLHA